MESKQSRRRFLKHCMKFGGTCCTLLAFNLNLKSEDSPEEKKNQEKRTVDLKQLSYCGIPCMQVCELYVATQKNDVEMKKLVYEKWGMKKKFGFDFDPDKVFCHTCKPGDKPKKIDMDKCVVRNCALANGVESCVQCKNLAACDKEYWKKWPEVYEFAKRTQAQYITRPGAILLEIKQY